MSKAQGLFPLFLATAFGIANGIWIFGPTFKEQRQNEDLEGKALEHPIQTPQTEALRKAEVEDSRAATTEATLNHTKPSNSWWSLMSSAPSGSSHNGSPRLEKAEESSVKDPSQNR